MILVAADAVAIVILPVFVTTSMITTIAIITDIAITTIIVVIPSAVL